MRKITCNQCQKIKFFNEFVKDKNRKDGIVKTCKKCKAANSRKWYKRTNYWFNNKYKIQCKNKNNRVKRIQRWVAFFEKEYGINPTCNLCEKQLEWWSSDKSRKVNFDHRLEGREPIKTNPARWYQDKSCSKGNIKIWKQCQFGILCNTCNTMLPTKNRLKWLEKATLYSKTNEKY